MYNILDAPFVREMCEITANMYRMGWDERNGGNVSWRIDEGDITPYIDVQDVKRTLELGFHAPELAGQYYIVTATNSYFRSIQKDSAKGMGIIRIGRGGDTYDILWGYDNGGRPTSELPTHMMNHLTRQRIDPAHRVVLHAHPVNTLAMTFVHDLDEKAFTKTLWRMITECILVFPDGIGVLPWMVCGTNEIGEATCEKLKTRRLVVWGQHGIFGTGKDMDEAFGLVETVEKAAEIYNVIGARKVLQSITDAQLAQVAAAFGIAVREGYLQ